MLRNNQLALRMKYGKRSEEAAHWNEHPAPREMLFGPAFEDERAVGTTKTEGVRESVVDLCSLWLVGNVVQAALGVELYDVHSGRGCLLEHRHDGDAGFESACAAEKMAGHGLGGADEQGAIFCAIAEDVFDGVRFQ